MRLVFLAYVLIWCVISSGCGYHMQSSKNPLHDIGVQTIFVENFKNASFRPGIEQLFTAAMAREIEKGRAFRLVDSPKAADAILKGEISSAAATVSSTRPVERGNRPVQAAAEYRAAVSCTITLVDRAKRVVFSHVATGDKVFPGALQVGPEGATVSLVNDSEERIAYQFLSSQMMSSTYQHMIDIF